MRARIARSNAEGIASAADHLVVTRRVARDLIVKAARAASAAMGHARKVPKTVARLAIGEGGRAGAIDASSDLVADGGTRNFDARPRRHCRKFRFH